MRVLALADRPFHADVADIARQHELDAILCLGDLQPSWLESLDRVPVPKFGVYGNHDDEPYAEWFGIDNCHLNRFEMDNGITVSGFEGCVAYRRSSFRVGPAYTQKQAKKLIRKLPPAELLLCHCPPFGVNDDPDDPAHIGFLALRDWVLEHKPRWLLHGHVHPRPGSIVRHFGETRVVYVNGAQVLDLS